ncbi:MAG: hypothetical protein LBS04_02425 [Tannerellaceae bacterium]|jgi:hypothetical protein|nr:hypothetical protein [Tannerellaceae bacterium]
MKTKVFFGVVITAILSFSACEQEFIEPEGGVRSNNQDYRSVVSVENKNGKSDGVDYAVHGVSMVSDVISLTEKDVTFNSTAEEISAGLLNLSEVSAELAVSLKKDNILYIRLGEYTGLKKITGVETAGEGVYHLETARAQLGEVFRSGTIDVSVDLFKASIAREESRLRSGKAYSCEILNLQDEYDLGNGFKYNPATNINMTYTFRMAFSGTQILPAEITNAFEVQLTVNPALSFAGSFNRIDRYELSEYMPQVLLDYLKSQSFDFKIPINTLGIDSLAATLKIKDIKMPLNIEANLSNQSLLSYGLNGSYKIGYTVAINGLKPTVTPIYENNLVATNPSLSDTYGELLTSAKIDITPDISVLDGAYSVDGTLSFENKSSTYGNISLPGKAPAFGSKSVNLTKLIANIDLILLKIPVTVINTEEELWNIGTIVKSVVYSDLEYILPSSYTDDYGILGSIIQAGSFKRIYKDTEFKLNYKYPILGKKIPDELIISYDIYAANGTTQLTSVKDAVIRPSDITAGSFKFKQDVLFSGETTYEKIGEEKKKIGFITITVPVYGYVTRCESKSYLKNIVIKDNNGYVYEGIFNTAKGVVENSIEINRP